MKQLNWMTGVVATVLVLTTACGADPGPDLLTPGDAGTTPHTVTVSGTAWAFNGPTLDAATVIIIGKGSTTTDARGRFSFSNVTVPYDIAVLTSREGATAVTLYKGVTRADPRVVAISGTKGRSSSTIRGTLSGNVLSPTGVQRDTGAVFTSPDLAHVESTTWPSFTGNSFSARVEWPTIGTATGTLHVLQKTRNSTTGFPIDFSYGRAEGITVANGTSSQVDVALGPVATDVLTASIQVPAGFTFSSASVQLRLGGGQSLHVYSQEESPAFSVKVPRIPGMSLGLSAQARRGNSVVVAQQSGLDTSRGATLQLPEGVLALSLPAAGATEVDLSTQAFSWSPFGASVSVALITTETLAVNVVTAGTRFVLPPTAELGLGGLPVGTGAYWSVTSYAGSTSTDQVLDPARGVTEALYSFDHAAAGATSGRSFTTK